MSEDTEGNSLIDVIKGEIASDDSNRDSQSQRLAATYENSTDRESIDKLLIALCGWSFGAIQRRQRTTMKPITPAQAIRLWASGKSEIFRLYDDDAEGAVENAEELAEAIEYGHDLGIEEGDSDALRNL